MKRDDLKKLLGDGVADDVIDKIMSENGKDIEAQKAKIAAAESEAQTAKEQLVEANKQIEAFKGMDIEGVKKAADDWKLKAETAEAEAKKTVEALKFDHALDAALTAAKAKDVVSVKAHLKTEAMKLQEDGSIVGLNEQLEKIKADEKTSFLFWSEQPEPKIVTGANNQPLNMSAFEAALLKGAGLDKEK